LAANLNPDAESDAELLDEIMAEGQITQALAAMEMFVDQVDPDQAQEMLDKIHAATEGFKVLPGTPVLVICLLAREMGEKLGNLGARRAKEEGFYNEDFDESFRLSVKQAVAMCVSLFVQTDCKTLKEAMDQGDEDA
jgi:hypothetical protein